ncbi:MAG: hypothetical protein HY304_02000 [candidate division Zixibacteria bacterium]|nr:hypothetical protein [candidate division Zixibacteria bacterium]
MIANRLRRGPTTPQFVDRMLGAYLRFYAGILVNPWTREEIRGQHQAMITPAEMHQILLVRSGRSHPVKHEKYNPAFPLRRTVLCGICLRPLTGSSPRGNGGRYFYYHCANRTCMRYGHSIPKDIVERDFRQHVEGIVPKDAMRTAFKETVLDLWHERGARREDARRHHEQQIAALEAKRRRIYEMREDGSYAREEFLARKVVVERELADLSARLEAPQAPAFDAEVALDYALAFIGDLGGQWFRLPPPLRPRFQKLIFPAGIPYSPTDGFGTAQLGLVFNTLREFDASKSRLVHREGFNWNQLLDELHEWAEIRAQLTEMNPDDRLAA